MQSVNGWPLNMRLVDAMDWRTWAVSEPRCTAGRWAKREKQPQSDRRNSMAKDITAKYVFTEFEYLEGCDCDKCKLILALKYAIAKAVKIAPSVEQREKHDRRLALQKQRQATGEI